MTGAAGGDCTDTSRHPLCCLFRHAALELVRSWHAGATGRALHTAGSGGGPAPLSFGTQEAIRALNDMGGIGSPARQSIETREVREARRACKGGEQRQSCSTSSVL